jgi:hypothetical protein
MSSGIDTTLSEATATASAKLPWPPKASRLAARPADRSPNPYLADHANAFDPCCERRLQWGSARALVDIEEVHSRRPDVDQNLVGPGARTLDINVFKNVGRPKLVHHHRAHIQGSFLIGTAITGSKESVVLCPLIAA